MFMLADGGRAESVLACDRSHGIIGIFGFQAEALPQAYLVKNPANFGPLVLVNGAEARGPTQYSMISAARA